MRNSKGSILAITVGFALVFTMLGIASIYMAGLQSETQEKQILSHQAFWLAEAGVNKAIALWPDIGYISTPEYLPSGGRGDFYFEILLAGTNERGIRSTGTINNQSRRLFVIAYRPDLSITNALICNGIIDNPGSNPRIDPSITQESANFTFDGVFGTGTTDIKNLANYTYDNTDSVTSNDFSATSPISGITWVTLPANTTFLMPPQFQGSGLLVLESTGGTTIHISGTGPEEFNGVIYIMGNLTFSGSPHIYGSIFVEGTTTCTEGNPDVQYRASSIKQAVPPVIRSWEEENLT